MKDVTTADLIKTIIMMKKFCNIINPISEKSLFLQILNCLLRFLIEPAHGTWQHEYRHSVYPTFQVHYTHKGLLSETYMECLTEMSIMLDIVPDAQTSVEALNAQQQTSSVVPASKM